jgi:Fanconi anemia group M protein
MEITNLQPRLYQEQIFSTATQKNVLAILPTGLGKTAIALMLAIHRLKQFPDSRIIFSAPTKPLCDQHLHTFQYHLPELKESDFALVTGLVKPSEREELYKKKFIFATPQTLANDLISERLSLEDISLFVVDEAHRAVGDYDYVFLAKHYAEKAKHARILALTASPGTSKAEINQICTNLFIEEVEVRDESSEDVAEYVQEKEVKRIMIELPEELREVKQMLERSLKSKLHILKENKVIQSEDIDKIRKSQLLMMQGSFVRQAKGNWFLMNNISTIAAAIKVMHCLELLQTQGIQPLRVFLDSLKIQALKVKASKSLMEDTDFREAMKRIYEMESKGIEHPKFAKLVELIKEYTSPNKRIIIFTQYRNTADKIVEHLSAVQGIKPVKFIGQKSGMSQKEQLQTINDFKTGVYNTLVATCIAEEGLHVETADLGIFFEPVPSALRSIQREGRIGRTNIGTVLVLITQDTIDEKYYWVSFHKRNKMKKAIEDIKKDGMTWQTKL